MNYFLLFITAMVTTLLLVPPVKRLAQKTGALDEPNERKVHSGRVARMGGLAMFLAFLLTYLVFFNQFHQLRGVYVGMLIMVIIGMLDDSMGLEPKFKLAGQVLAALAAMTLSDVNINFLGATMGLPFHLGALGAPLTVLWIVGITNAINLSDGLDGLASGISLIAFTCFGVLAYQRGDVVIFSLCLILVGCILGFLKYNTHPAEIFMGDTGSLFLGYSLGTLSIAGNFKSLTLLGVLTPILVLLIPIADTLWAIVRRVREGRSPFSPDKKHIHHALLNAGLHHHQAVSAIYAISTLLSGAAVALSNSSNLKFVLFPVLILSLALFLGRILGFVSLSKLTAGFSDLVDRIMPREWHTPLMRLSMFGVVSGVAIYSFLFLAALPFMPANLLWVVAIISALVISLGFSRSQNGQGFAIFSLFFLAASFTLVVDQINNELSSFSFPFASVETAAFLLLTCGVLGKIFFRKRKDLILTTPLEYFIFLIVLTIAMVPEEIRTQFDLGTNVARTVLLFLGFKVLALTHLENKYTAHHSKAPIGINH